MMEPGFYVVRSSHRGIGNRLIIESCRFGPHPSVDLEWVKLQANNWRDFIQSQHPKDDVVLIEVFATEK
jgi:hypothetical protein